MKSLLELAEILERTGDFDLSEELRVAAAEVSTSNAFQGKMVSDLGQKGKLKKKPKFPKKPPPPPPEEGGEGGEAPPEGGETPPEGGEAPPEGQEAPPEGQEAPPEGGEAPPEEAPPEEAPPEQEAPPAEEAPAEEAPKKAPKKASARFAANSPGDREWLACSDLKREEITSGSAWTAMCLFIEKKSQKIGYMKRVVGKGKKRPQPVRLGGKNIKVVGDLKSVGRKIKKKMSKK